MNKKILKIFGLAISAIILLQTAITTYASIFGDSRDNEVDISNVFVSQEIQNIIRQQDISSFNKNLTAYKRMIVLLDVHENYKTEIERLINEGKRINDLMAAYTFLNDCYGKIDELEQLVIQKEQGKSWVEIFTNYNNKNIAFVPRNFDFNYLDELMTKEGITTDDIMICDRVSQKSGVPYEEIIELRLEGKTWKEINAELGIVNAQNIMPHVPVTPEQIKKYTADGRLNEEEVVFALVTSYKLGIDETEAINKAKSGYTPEMFFSEAVEKKYY